MEKSLRNFFKWGICNVGHKDGGKQRKTFQRETRSYCRWKSEAIGEKNSLSLLILFFEGDNCRWEMLLPFPHGPDGNNSMDQGPWIPWEFHKAASRNGTQNPKCPSIFQPLGCIQISVTLSRNQFGIKGSGQSVRVYLAGYLG